MINDYLSPTHTHTAILNPPSDDSFYPNWKQCVLNDNTTEFNTTDLYTCSFNKRDENTTLKVSWDGNAAVTNCSDCCVRWYIAIDGEECADPGPVDGAIRQDLSDSGIGTFDLYRPMSIAGICRGTNSTTPLANGDHVISLGVGACEPADDGSLIPTSTVVTGYNSVSRFIIEELPNQIEENCIVPT